MALAAAAKRNRYVDQEIREYEVATNIKIWEGALVSINAGGYLALAASGAGPIVAGIAYETVDNTGGANGAKKCRVWTQGDFELPLGSATIANIGDSVYATADDAISTTPGTTNYLGLVVGFVSAGIVIVRLHGTEAAP